MGAGVAEICFDVFPNDCAGPLHVNLCPGFVTRGNDQGVTRSVVVKVISFFDYGDQASNLLPVFSRNAIKVRFARNNLCAHWLLRGELSSVGEPRSSSYLGGVTGYCNWVYWGLFFDWIWLALHIRFAEASDGHFHTELFILLPVTSPSDGESELI